MISLRNNGLKYTEKDDNSITAFDNILQQGTADIIQKTRNSTYTGNSIPIQGTKVRAQSKSKAVAAKSSENQLAGVTLSTMLTSLVESRGFEALYMETNLRCFKIKPDVKSSLKVLQYVAMFFSNFNSLLCCRFFVNLICYGRRRN